MRNLLPYICVCLLPTYPNQPIVLKQEFVPQVVKQVLNMSCYILKEQKDAIRRKNVWKQPTKYFDQLLRVQATEAGQNTQQFLDFLF